MSQGNILEEWASLSYLVALLLEYVHIDLGGFAVAVAFHGAHSLHSIGKAAKNPLQMIISWDKHFADKITICKSLEDVEKTNHIELLESSYIMGLGRI